MAAGLIYERVLKVISKPWGEMPELKENGHFQIFTAIFATMRGSPQVDIANVRTPLDETLAAGLTMPLMMVQGKEDRVAPAATNAELLAAALPHARLVIACHGLSFGRATLGGPGPAVTAEGPN